MLRRLHAQTLLLVLLLASPAAAQVGNFSRVIVNGVTVTTGSGAPEGAVIGAVGDVYIRTNGTIYTKTSGTGNTGWSALGSGGGSGTVTSVGVTMPSLFAVSGSPVTTSGTIAAALANQSAGTVLAGPTSGAAAEPTFRSIVFGDWASNSCTSGQIPKYNGSAWACSDDAGASSGAPSAAQYVTLATDATLTNERVLTAGSGISITDGGAGSTVTIAATGGGGTPGGVDKQIQYNNAGAFGGVSNATAGYVLTSNGTGATPTFQAIPPNGVSAIEPDAISGLQMWLDAEAITGLVDNDPVATWTDQSGVGNDATQGTAGNRPIYKTNILNGKPVVRFDNSNDGMTTTLTLANPYTIIYVGNFNNADANRRAIQGQVQNRFLGPYSGRWQVYTGSFLPLGLPLPHANFVIHGMGETSEIAGWFLYESGGFPVSGLQSGTATGTFTAIGAVGLGASGSIAEPFGGDMAEVVAYNRMLTNAEARGLIQYFINKYGL